MRLAMTNGDRCVGEWTSLHHQSRHRLSDDVASTDHDALRSPRLNLARLEDELYACRRARHEPIRLADEQLSNIDWMKSVDVLFRTKAPNHDLWIDLPR